MIFVVRGAESYGVQRKLLSIMRSLLARGVKTTLYAVGDGEFVDRVRALGGVDILLARQPPPRFVGRGWRKIISYLSMIASSSAMVRGLSAYLAACPADALVFCERGWVVPLAFAMRRYKGPSFWLMPDVVSAGYPLDLNRLIYDQAFRQSGMTPIANSRHTRQTLGRAAAYAETIALGADPAEFNDKRRPAAQLPGLPDDAVKLLIVGRLVEHKGQLVFLRAMLSRPEFSKLHLILAGGPLESPFAAELKAAAPAQRLHVLGPVPDPASYYAAADVVVNARIDAEPFGLSIVEAMMSAKPVLAHALGGPGEIIVDGLTGWLVQQPSVDGFAEGLQRMLADRSRWKEMGAAGERRALETYTSASMTDQLVEIIDRHLRGGEG